MRRRELIALTVFALFSARIRALAQQQPRKVSRIGYLGTGGPTQMVLDAFRHGLRDLGWVEGQNLVIEYRFAEGHLERLPDLAAELVGLDVHVIAATPAALAAKAASRVVPVVGISFDNPVEHGLIESLARPGGNVTGLAYSVGPEIFAKDLALLRELVPEVRKVAVLSGPMRGVNYSLMLQNVASAAQVMGLELSIIEAKTLPDDFEPAFADMEKAKGPGAPRLG